MGQYQDEAPLGSWNAFGALAGRARRGPRRTSRSPEPGTAPRPSSIRPCSRAWKGCRHPSPPVSRAPPCSSSPSSTPGSSTSRGPLGAAVPGIEQGSVAYRNGAWALGAGGRRDRRSSPVRGSSVGEDRPPPPTG
ncbi:MAG: hypothetical protein M0C28_39165 [Candidatus Moduliflexus flocculans]|nr:hypothetical protein [Candidatus Moduliflexus flocculans]